MALPATILLRPVRAPAGTDAATSADRASPPAKSGRLVGLAAVWNSQYPISPGRDVFERLLPDAVRWSDDTVALVAHQRDQTLGRVGAGTLSLESTAEGLEYAIDLDLQMSYAADLARSVGRGDTRGASVSLRLASIESSWSLRADGFPLHSIRRALLTEVSPLSLPASTATNVPGAVVIES